MAFAKSAKIVRRFILLMRISLHHQAATGAKSWIQVEECVRHLDCFPEDWAGQVMRKPVIPMYSTETNIRTPTQSLSSTSKVPYTEPPLKALLNSAEPTLIAMTPAVHA